VDQKGEQIMEAKVEALMENLAVAVMQADNLAADSPEYEALAETLAYALDLAELGFVSRVELVRFVGATQN
jgi:hypothetical protein